MRHPELARDIDAIAHLEGDFVLRSGARSREYFDKYRFESDPALLGRIARAMAPLVPEGVDLLAGLEMGGIPVVTALSMETGIPGVFVRKQAKEYGTCMLAEGAEIAGRRLLVVEDVVSSGGQIVLSSQDLRERGARVEQALCVIDRESGGREKLHSAGIELLALLTQSDLAAHRS